MKPALRVVLLGSALLLAPGAFAQSNPSGEAPVDNTGATTTSGTKPEDLQGQFLERLEPNQMLGSTLMKATIMGADNQRIGTVSDVLLDQDGKIAAVTTDVGGFLGIGAKTIAIPVRSFQLVTGEAPAGTDIAANQQASGSQNPAGIGTTQPQGASGGTQPAASGADSGTAAGASGSNAPNGARDPGKSGGPLVQGQTGRLDHIQVTYSREQLRNAPEFKEGE